MERGRLPWILLCFRDHMWTKSGHLKYNACEKDGIKGRGRGRERGLSSLHLSESESADPQRTNEQTTDKRLDTRHAASAGWTVVTCYQHNDCESIGSA